MVDGDSCNDPIASFGRTSFPLVYSRDNSHTMQLCGCFNWDDSAVFAQNLSQNGPDPVVVRVTDISCDADANLTDVTMKLLEFENNYDGIHVGEDISVLLVKRGTHTLEDGTTIQGMVAENIDTNFSEQELTHGEDVEKPMVLAFPMSYGDQSHARIARINHLDDNGNIEVKVDPEEALLRSGEATSSSVSIIAISRGVDSNDEFFDSQLLSSVSHNSQSLTLRNSLSNTEVNCFYSDANIYRNRSFICGYKYPQCRTWCP